MNVRLRITWLSVMLLLLFVLVAVAATYIAMRGADFQHLAIFNRHGPEALTIFNRH